VKSGAGLTNLKLKSTIEFKIKNRKFKNPHPGKDSMNTKESSEQQVKTKEAHSLLSMLETELLAANFDANQALQIVKKMMTLNHCKGKTKRCLLRAIAFQTAFHGLENEKEWLLKWSLIIAAFNSCETVGSTKQVKPIMGCQFERAIQRGINLRKEYEKKDKEHARRYYFNRIYGT
jgi:hypothetical protein